MNDIKELQELVKICCHNKTHLEIYYSKKKGGKNRYVVEPYEIKGGKLWAYDTNAGQIKQFLMSNIESPGNIEDSPWEVDEDHKRNSWERKEVVSIPDNTKLVKRKPKDEKTTD